MRALDPAVVTALEENEVFLIQLIKLAFSGGTVALNSSNVHIEHDGDTYTGAKWLGLSAVRDEAGELTGLQMSLGGLDSTLIALALDEAGVVQGTPVTVKLAILDKTTGAVLDVVTDWVGYADTMTITEEGGSATITATMESKAVDLLRGHPLTYSNADQQALFPGDLAFAYVNDQVDKQVVWPQREFFFR